MIQTWLAGKVGWLVIGAVVIASIFGLYEREKYLNAELETKSQQIEILQSSVKQQQLTQQVENRVELSKTSKDNKSNVKVIHDVKIIYQAVDKCLDQRVPNDVLRVLQPTNNSDSPNNNPGSSSPTK